MLLTLLLACQPKPPPAPPGVLLVTVDTWRSDSLHPDWSPNAWALADGGLSFRNAWSPIGLTSPAHASLFTGLLPPVHGVRGNNHHGYRLAPSFETVAETLQAQGIATGGFVSAYPVAGDAGLDQGFDVFSGPEQGERSGELAVSEALAWIAEQQGPWFAWVHVYEPHGPYTPPAADLAAASKQPAPDPEVLNYRGEVHAADRILGPLYTAAQQRGAHIVLTADHGEVLTEEPCSWRHAVSSSPMVLRVPMVVSGPSVQPGVRDDMVGLTDLRDTLLHLSGVQAPTRGVLDPSTREVWLGESGLCEAQCAPGCSPEGVLGKDRVAFGEAGGMYRDRPGVGGYGDPMLARALEGYPRPEAGALPGDLEKGAALGYTTQGAPR